MQIQHIFFDLDHTLWDFNKNSKLTFQQLFSEFKIPIKVDDFLEVYLPINFNYWKLYREEKISKPNLQYARVKDTFNALEYTISDKLINTIAKKYITYLPNYNHLINGTLELLAYLQPKYKLHIITNGFEEVQNLKLEKAGIKKFFKEIITSETVGAKKPNPKIFESALLNAGTTAQESIMIGDNLEADIMGALEVGMLAIHCNFNKSDSKSGLISVKTLKEIQEYL